jgi:hypothetical protein
VIATATKTADVAAFALRLADVIQSCGNRSSDVSFEAYRVVFDDFIDGVACAAVEDR